jgi:hypothetical protein
MNQFQLYCNPYEAVEKFISFLEEGQTGEGDLLHGVTIVRDRDSLTAANLPCIAVELEKSRVTNTGTLYPLEEEHNVSVICLVSAQNTSFAAYKRNALELAEKVRTKVLSIEDHYPLNRVTFGDKSYSESYLDSQKVSGVIWDVTFREPAGRFNG